MLIDHVAGSPGAGPEHDIARLRLVCLVRSGDGYVVRAVGRLAVAASVAQPRRHLDIAFGDAADRSGSAELDHAVRQVQRWCEEGTTVALVEAGAALCLRAEDGTRIALPRSA